MTQEELLAHINWEIECCDWGAPTQQELRWVGIMKALRAVVELHWHNDIKSSTGEVLETYCLECPNLSSYPCLTIQAIEKELG